MSNTNPNDDDAVCIRVEPDDSEPEEFDSLNDPEIRSLARQLTENTTASVDLGVESNNSEDEAELIQALTRQSTRLSQINAEGIPPFNSEDPRLDPNSPDFSSKYWIKNLRAMQDKDLDYYKPCSLGIVYKNLSCHGVAAEADYKTDCINWIAKTAQWIFQKVHPTIRKFEILKPMDGLIAPGSLVAVLGRPGAGCTTLLKTMSSQTYGFHVGKDSIVSYQGLTPEEIRRNYRGDVIYSAETEIHFPHLTVAQTLKFAALMKVPRNRPEGITRDAYAEHMALVYMAMFGLLHTYNTKVGDDYVRGVSGGQRKRVSLAEVSVCGSKIQCWDNSTRGLDSAAAGNFVKCLKLSCQVLDTTSIISIYQCSQDTYDLFDKVILLYEGRQIFFGDASSAKAFFERQGWECPQRQATADFLTSLTAPNERRAKPGWEHKVPQTPEEFEHLWRASPEYKLLQDNINQADTDYKSEEFRKQILESKKAAQSKHISANESFTVSYSMQVKYLLMRAFQRIRNNPSVPVFTVVSNFIMGLLNSSIFFNLQDDTSSVFGRGACLFFACLFNSLMSLLEVFALYESRPIVEKHQQYALYHPSAEAMASIISEIPTKLCTSISFNLTLYFMVNFKRTPGAFFFYFLIGTTATFVMSHLFRTIGALSKSLSQSMTPASLVVLCLSVYTGFVVPRNYMLGWSRWINYINPIAYVFESMMINEFTGRKLACTSWIPTSGAYDEVSDQYKICSTVSSVAGESTVNGDLYIKTAYNYIHAHKWRNWGISVGFMIFFFCTYLLAAEYNKSARQSGEKAVFLDSGIRKLKKQGKIGKVKDDVENQNSYSRSTQILDAEHDDPEKEIVLDSGGDTFHWHNVCYDIPYMGGTRRLLEGVDGWVKPGTLTALMGASGAGKTTLLDVLADRVTMGVVTGDMLVNSSRRDKSFQRSTGYVQQRDLHLDTATVRESLRFSAYLRQPNSVSKQEKNEYVEKIITLLEMEDYADAVVGVPGEGLNVEQRKRLTIGVELVAKPKLLLFLDEPTSGLDSQTAWSILCLIKKLSAQGQAIMCTIHQPSAMLFSQFDSLLLLKSGGQTVYFGPIGENSETLINYFEGNHSIPCPKNGNPAEWMLEAIGAAPGAHPDRDWYKVWRESPEYGKIQGELAEMVVVGKDREPDSPKMDDKDSSYASSLWTQYIYVTKRVFQQYWRTPSYISYKFMLVILASLLNGFTFFKAKNSIQGIQNQMFSVFMFTALHVVLVAQMVPHFIDQRSLYEVRERPSRTFSWFAFITAQITVEIPWMVLCATVSFLCFYFPVGFYNNATGADMHRRGVLLWLMCVEFFVWSISCGQMCIAAVDSDQNAATIATLLYSLSTLFCGVLVSKDKMPGFWIFMYRVSPFTYWIAGFLQAALGNSQVTCGTDEMLTFPPPPLYTCEEYMSGYMAVAGGYLAEPGNMVTCQYCEMSNTNAYLEEINALEFTDWEDFGIFFVYPIVNMAATVFFYWLFRVPKKNDPLLNLRHATHRQIKAFKGKRQSATKKLTATNEKAGAAAAIA